MFACRNFLKYKLKLVEGSCAEDGDCEEVTEHSDFEDWVSLDIVDYKPTITLNSQVNREFTNINLQLEAYLLDDNQVTPSANLAFTINLYPDCESSIIKEGNLSSRSMTKN